MRENGLCNVRCFTGTAFFQEFFYHHGLVDVGLSHLLGEKSLKPFVSRHLLQILGDNPFDVLRQEAQIETLVPLRVRASADRKAETRAVPMTIGFSVPSSLSTQFPCIFEPCSLWSPLCLPGDSIGSKRNTRGEHSHLLPLVGTQ